MFRESEPQITYERIIRIGEDREPSCRLWVPDAGENHQYFRNIRQAIRNVLMAEGFFDVDSNMDSYRRIATSIITSYKINAIELTTAFGQGVVLYADWP